MAHPSNAPLHPQAARERERERVNLAHQPSSHIEVQKRFEKNSIDTK